MISRDALTCNRCHTVAEEKKKYGDELPRVHMGV